MVEKKISYIPRLYFSRRENSGPGMKGGLVFKVLKIAR